MTLADYLAGEKLTPSQLAERIGVPPSTITRIISGKRTPRLETIALIEGATSGAVTAADFMAQQAARPEPKGAAA